MIQKKPVFKICMDTEAILERYESLCDAAREHNTHPAAISRVINGKRGSHLGFFWEQDCENPKVFKPKKRTLKPVARRKYG